jgi:hypothetical protein
MTKGTGVSDEKDGHGIERVLGTVLAVGGFPSAGSGVDFILVGRLDRGLCASSTRGVFSGFERMVARGPDAGRVVSLFALEPMEAAPH